MYRRRVYFCHCMEGLQIPEESGTRGLEARKLLGENFILLLPEEWQASVPHTEIQKIDLMKLESADIILVDFHRMGLVRNGEAILGRGTNQEVGYAKGLNKCGKKKRPIIQIVRQHKFFHPFDKEGSVHNCNSLEEACLYIKENYGRK